MANNNNKRIYFEDGTSMKYVSLHTWVRNQKGKPLFCSNSSSHEAKRYEWANISGRYRKDVNDYKSLCPSCHRKEDLTEKTREKFRKRMLGGPSYASKPILQLELTGRPVRMFKSVTEASRFVGVARSAISNCLIGKSKMSAGYKWNYE